jgi:uncharacterized OB-fold protein
MTTSHTPSRPTPPADRFVTTEAFWRAARDRKLYLQYCRDSGRFQHYPRPVSIYCGGRRLEWREVSGRGKIYAHTVLRIGPPDLSPRLPLPIVLVELEEGVRILGNILGDPAATIRIGQAVEVSWDMLDDGQPYPAFSILE